MSLGYKKNKKLKIPKSNCFPPFPIPFWYALRRFSAKLVSLKQRKADSSFKVDITVPGIPEPSFPVCLRGDRLLR